ncbi:MAG TPA: thioester domain-containing protein [Solirubrobacteraceae bacterium]|nr:thioester domain-containing protein [Solirubrobacteraceae bacterium]
MFVLALGSLLLQVASAGAVVRKGPRPTRTGVRGNTEMTVTGWSPGHGVIGFIADRNNPFDPVLDGYPASNPTTGFAAKDEGFAGVIHGTPAGGGPNLDLYCIDINTDTTTGIGYALGTWDASNVQNVGYVARILNEYYPNTNEPTELANGTAASPNQTAAAVQAAIWFFSDRYVLNTSDELHDTVVGIVNKIRAEGPLIEPPPPSITITPGTASGARRVLGPFTVKTNAPGGATVNATGANMFANRAGTMPIAPGATVPSNTKIWLRSSGPSTAVLQATSQATVPTGNVYLYDGNSNVSDAQRLILAKNATLATTVQATAEFLPGGKLVVTKTIAGAAAGSQGQVVIHVDCDDGVPRRDFVIPAGTPAGTTSRTYRHIAAGTTCTVTETSNGTVIGTDVVVAGDGQEVTIPAGGSKTVLITDTYSAVPSPTPGSLYVTKTITGPLAGKQGPLTIQVVCNGTTFPDFTIPAGTTAGSYSQSFGPVPAGSVCTVTETADGATGTVTAIVSGNGETVTVPAGEVVPVNVIDAYELGPSPTPDVSTGTLRVTKTIAGPAAGQQGRIAILVACGDPAHTYAYVIPGHTRPGSESRSFAGIPAGSRCTITEAANGHSGTVQASTIGRRKTVTIQPNRTATVHVTDMFFGVSSVAVTG